MPFPGPNTFPGMSLQFPDSAQAENDLYLACPMFCIIPDTLGCLGAHRPLMHSDFLMQNQILKAAGHSAGKDFWVYNTHSYVIAIPQQSIG